MATTTTQAAPAPGMMSRRLSTVDSLFFLAIGVIVIGSVAGFFLR